ncbi:Linoleoyl phosphatidylcholine delta-12 acetylenase [Mycena chlorophos]|uniref:Linoleoyl phosphatidylcholine delta-12 acetylenase n=1 Tax=Mycena chlorophos TaxID=658473 RepID=A0A8H6TPG0_MYCCL|nr:Linoleoyl phosphatidylcholine delta-12 acetylenase [Mycena chlorophos]
MSSQTSELEKYQPLPISCSLQDIRSAIPKHCFVRSARRSLTYLLRDLVMAAMLFLLVRKWDKLAEHISGTVVVRWTGWAVYWWFQGLVFTGIWVLGHECGHGAFSPYPLLNDTLGYIIHSALWTPYFSWKISHHRHHTYHASMERDEVYVPKTRTDLGLPSLDHATALDYEEILGDTPLFTLFMLVRQQLLAFPAYLLLNVSGQQRYPRWTNHFLPNSVLFTRKQRTAVLLSNLGLFVTAFDR